MSRSLRYLTACVVIAIGLLAVAFRSFSAQGDIVWRDTERKARGVSPPTKNNNTVHYGGNCPAASDDGKWCASIVEVHVDIGPGDPEEFYRLKYFQETRENCSKVVYVQSGPQAWNSTIDCKFDPSLRHFVLRQKGWTSPQTFAAEITIQERVTSDKK